MLGAPMHPPGAQPRVPGSPTCCSTRPHIGPRGPWGRPAPACATAARPWFCPGVHLPQPCAVCPAIPVVACPSLQRISSPHSPRAGISWATGHSPKALERSGSKLRPAESPASLELWAEPLFFLHPCELAPLSTPGRSLDSPCRASVRHPRRPHCSHAAALRSVWASGQRPSLLRTVASMTTGTCRFFPLDCVLRPSLVGTCSPNVSRTQGSIGRSTD